jgi:hypothetical protein
MARTLEYDFSSFPDGSLPTGMGVGILASSLGVDNVLDETSPILYYSVSGGKAVFNYTEQVVGADTYRRGYVSLLGSLEGSDSEVSVKFSDPLVGFSEALEEVLVWIGLGLRGKDRTLEWVGGVLESHWVKGTGWVPAFKLSVAKVFGTVIDIRAFLEKSVRYEAVNELVVSTSGQVVTASFNGVEQISEEIDFRGEDQVALWVKAIANNGVSFVPLPIIMEISGQSLAVEYPMVEIPGNYVEPPADGSHCFNFPVRELMRTGYLKQLTHNTWQFVKEIVIDRPQEYQRFKATPGAKIVAHRQTLVDAEVQVCRFLYGR